MNSLLNALILLLVIKTVIVNVVKEEKNTNEIFVAKISAATGGRPRARQEEEWRGGMKWAGSGCCLAGLAAAEQGGRRGCPIPSNLLYSMSLYVNHDRSIGVVLHSTSIVIVPTPTPQQHT